MEKQRIFQATPAILRLMETSLNSSFCFSRYEANEELSRTWSQRRAGLTHCDCVEL